MLKIICWEKQIFCKIASPGSENVQLDMFLHAPQHGDDHFGVGEHPPPPPPHPNHISNTYIIYTIPTTYQIEYNENVITDYTDSEIENK